MCLHGYGILKTERLNTAAACGMCARQKGGHMELKVLDPVLSVCRVRTAEEIPFGAEPVFVGKTDEELSLVCPSADVPESALERNDGWRAFRIQGILDFSLTGILSRLSTVLAEAGIGIFAVSTFNTDYVLVKKENLDRALRVLEDAGYKRI